MTSTHHEAARRGICARDPHEHPRAATPLELLFDLCFVVAIAKASEGLHHSIAEAHALQGALSFGMVFVAIWWAWMGFTWFASAFDPDDPLYRLKVLVQMTGALVIASGVPRAFEHGDYTIITIGYVVMRIGLVAQWLRVAAAVSDYRVTALRYAGGITVVQIGWVLLLLLAPKPAYIYGWFVLMGGELLVPYVAERARATPWHPHHIAERYGLLTIIVIGECVLSGTIAIQSALDTHDQPLGALGAIIASTPVLIFAMWWLYFSRPQHDRLRCLSAAFSWGYGHLLLFASIAAVGSGLAASVDFATGHGHLSATSAGYALAIPLVTFLAALLFCLTRGGVRASRTMLGGFAIAAAALLGSPLVTHSPLAPAAIMAILTFIVVREAETAPQKAAEA